MATLCYLALLVFEYKWHTSTFETLLYVLDQCSPLRTWVVMLIVVPVVGAFFFLLAVVFQLKIIRSQISF